MKRDAGKEKLWREAIAKASSSAASIREFCRQRGLKENLFYSWRRELRLRDAEGTDRPGFVELVRPAGRNGAGVSLRIDERVEILLERGFDREALKAALACLGDARREAAVAAEAQGA
jgi:transposase-like protein